MEVQPKSRKILRIGGLLAGDQYAGNNLGDFFSFSTPANLLCGHNIIDHDLAILREAGMDDHFFNRPALDTLYWSVLLFPQKPYHPLVKDYHLAGTELNNPLADAQITRELLGDLLHRFKSLPLELQTIYVSLLKTRNGFSGLFELIGEDKLPSILEKKALAEFYAQHFSDLYCSKAKLEEVIKNQGLELAYATALISTKDPDSLPPPWLIHRFPEVQQVLNQLRIRCDGQGQCPYCKFLSPQKGLKRFFGFDQFRRFEGDGKKPLQETVVGAALAERSLLAVFPTGGGKSLTFQLPALMQGAANRSLTVVISPLQSLMKDQVDVLQRRHSITSALTINGMLSPLERSEALERVRLGGANLLYIAPESLRSNTIFQLLKGRLINRFVIDEAHCFSAWGQDFRVDYLYIGTFIQKLQAAQKRSSPIPVSCFTATAKPSVVGDIQAYFQDTLNLELEVFQTNASRKNLSYYVLKAEGPENKFEKLLGLLQSEDGSKIVYVARVKMAEELARQLQQSGLAARAYHGKLDRDVKIRIQDEFMQADSELEVIVATSAFGMGVDKDDVCLVIHYHISDSLENYMQESGRAGRDPQLHARCVILFDEEDLNEHFNLLNSTKLNQKEVYQIWQGIKRFRKKSFTKSALEIAKQAGWDVEMYELETRVKTAIAALEDAGYLKREENAARIYAQSIRVKNVDEANTILDKNAHHFQGEQALQTAKRVFSSLISRSRSDEETRVDYMAEHLGLERNEVTHVLNVFKHIHILNEDKDLTAYYYPKSVKRNSISIFEKVSKVEQHLFELLFPHPESGERKVFLRELNEELIELGVESDLILLKDVLNYWGMTQVIHKERIDRTTEQYRIRRKTEHETFQRKLTERITAAKWCLQVFQSLYLPLAESDKDFKEKKLLRFSLADLQRKIESFWPREHDVRFYEYLLLYLHHVHAIELKSGLLVFYNPMKIIRETTNNRKQYTQEDYKKLARFYQSKTEQIHIVGAYAKKQLQYNEEAAQFVNDYFTLSYENFLDKYFPGNKKQLQQPVTEEKFKQLIGNLSTEQLNVIKDAQHSNILVAAGPGSGKTKVLVHKMASLLLLEDIKPEQFLMLTFSRPAALEFKNRLRQLVGKTAFYIDIFTFHGFAFQLAGRMGDLERAQEILPRVTTAIMEEEIPINRLRNKSVVVVDEFQDVSEIEYRFLMAIIEKAEKTRLLVVGDDDQNVYEFRGANLSYMRAFIQKQDAQIYYLTANYRARKNLLQLSNRYLDAFLNKKRLKHGIPLKAQRSEYGEIEIVHYDSQHLFLPLVEWVKKKKRSGTTAILTHTNEEAVILTSLLRQEEQPAQLIAEQRGFALRDLLEVRTFNHYLWKDDSDEFGLIPESTWKANKEKVKTTFPDSQNLDLFQRITKSYEQSHPKKFKSTWLAHLRESRVEDFYHPEKNVLLVSTMHKVKGKEFDQVFLLLDNYSLVSEEKRRVLYMAMTRARDHLFIHTNNLAFPSKGIPNLTEYRDNHFWPAPRTLTLHCGLHDVWLGFFKNRQTITEIKKLTSGQPLIPKDGASPIFQTMGKRDILWLSKSFEKKLQYYLDRGYSLSEAKIRHIVVWFDREEGKRFRAVLPEIILTRL